MNTLGVPLGIFVAFVLAHLSVRKFAPGADPAILPLAFALSGIGIAFVTRLAPDLAMRQVMWLFLGVVCMVVVLALLRNVDRLANYKYTLMIAGFVLLLSPMLPLVGQEINGSRIWLGIPGVISFQPGEIAKIAIVLFLAGYLAQNREMLSVFTWRVGPFRLPDIRTLLPLLLMWALAMVIVVFEKDLGSALVLFFVFLVMLYAATGKKFYLVIGLGLAAVAAVGLYFMFGHVQARVSIWLDPFADALDKGYQVVQALYSIADGDLFGVGIGRGMADVIPYVENDFVFAAIAEEAGLLGAAGVLLLYLCFAIRGFVTAARAKSDVQLVHRRGHDRGRGAAGVHHRGRRHAAHPADRHHAALHQPGRLVASGKLHHRGIPAALRRRRHGRGRGGLASTTTSLHTQQRAGTRVLGQTPDERHAAVLHPVRRAGGQPDPHHGGAGERLPEHAGQQPHVGARGQNRTRHHFHLRRHRAGQEREERGRHRTSGSTRRATWPAT